MSKPVIVTCAVTGGGDTTSASSFVPVTPRQIVQEALAAREAGAAIVHIHVRDPKTGGPSRDLALYREVVEKIRDSDSDVLINLTTGAGARFMPSAADPDHNAIAGMVSPAERMQHVLELLPDICSLDIATMNFGRHAFVNVPDHVEQIAEAVRKVGVKPELEVFDLGHAALARHLYDRGFFADPPWMQLCLGVPWGAPATTDAMLALMRIVPPGGHWSAFGISKHEFPMVAQAAILGGHVRVGLEDNLYYAKGELAQGNAPLVARAVRLVKEIGKEVATPSQAREILKIG